MTTYPDAQLEQVIRAFQNGDITDGEACRQLGIGLFTFNQIVAARGIDLYYTTQEEYDQDKEALERFHRQD